MYGAVPTTRAGQVLCCPELVWCSDRRSCDGGRQVPTYSVSVSPEIISTGAKPAVFCGANQVFFRHLLCLLVSNWLYLWIYILPCPLLHFGLRHLFFVEPRPQHRHHACHERTLREQLGVPYDATVSIYVYSFCPQIRVPLTAPCPCERVVRLQYNVSSAHA